MKVAVFGGAAAKPGEPAYQAALKLGILLGQAGFTVMTGGYIGVMEAASRGVNEAGAHVIGVTCAEIERWRHIKSNAWVIEEWHFETLRERLYSLVDNCDAAIIMPGGVGTLAELSIMWNELIIGMRDPRPMILVGEGWQTIINTFYEQAGYYIGVNDRGLIRFAEDVDSAVRILNESLSIH